MEEGGGDGGRRGREHGGVGTADSACWQEIGHPAIGASGEHLAVASTWKT